MDGNVKIFMGRSHGNCKIEIDGKDVSSLVRSFVIKADTDSVPTLEITIVPKSMEIVGNPDVVKAVDMDLLGKVLIRKIKELGFTI